MNVGIPVPLAVQGHGLPSVCARHGREAATRRTIKISQATPGWLYVLLLVGVVAFVIARVLYVSSVQAQGWPLCQECAGRRRTMLGGFIGGVVLGLITLFVGIAVIDSPAVFLAGLAISLAALFFLAPASWGSIARARLGAHSGWIEVSQAHEAFGEQVASVLPPPGAPYAVRPEPLMKRLSPMWYLGMAGGIVAAFYGAMTLLAGPSCGAEGEMRPGDVCETTSSSGMVTTTTYEDEVASGKAAAVAGGAGAVVAVLCLVRIRRYSVALRRVYAAQPVTDPVFQPGTGATQ